MLKKVFAKYISIMLAVVSLFFGFILSENYNEKLPRFINAGLSVYELNEMKENLLQENSFLKSGISKADEEIGKLENNLKIDEESSKKLVDGIEVLRKRAGLAVETGEGAVIYLADGEKRVEVEDSIAHASDLRDLVDYLWLRGARAISIEGPGGKEERIGPQTSIDCLSNTVLINSTQMVPPFKIKVLGNRSEIIRAVNDRIALKGFYDRKSRGEIIFSVLDNPKEIKVTKYSGRLQYSNAKLQK